MSLKSRFFKKTWQHSNPEKRLAAVRDEHDPELLAALPQLAEHDSEASVRRAALHRINTEPFWLDARLRETDPEILKDADRFLMRAVASEQAADLERERLQWLERIESSEAVRTLALKAKETSLRQRALERIQSQGFLGDCYVSESDSALADSVLERLDQISTLERLHRTLRKSNKSKAKAVLARMQAVQSEQGTFDVDQDNAERLVHQAETLARGEHLEQRDAMLIELRQAWEGLERAPESLETRFNSALSIVEAAIAKPAPESNDKSLAPGYVAVEATDAVSKMQAVAEKIREQLRQKEKGLKPQKLLAEWDRAWNDLGQIQPADGDVKNDMLPILRELQAQVQRQGGSASASSKASDEARRSEPRADIAAFDTTMDELAQSLEAGEIAQANEQRNRIRGQLQSLPVKQRPKEISGRLQRLEGRLKEMRDYQHWSHNSQRDELIARVESLPESGQHPDAISAALKEARTEWQRLEKLEVLPGDKRKFAAPAGQWRRFQDACSAAFETAKPFFEKRQTVQEKTLGRLEAFVESGLRLVEDESANPKSILQFMRKARQAIRRLDDLPPKSRGHAAGQLRGLMDSISTRLDSEFEQVELKKRRLITEATALSQEDDLKVAIDRAKGLQADWKRAGQGRRKIDQKLWKEFRAAIDPLFEQLDGRRKAREEADQAVIQEIETLCEQAETLAKLPDEELLKSGGRMQGLREALDSLHPKPPALIKRLDQAEREFSDRRTAIRKAQEEQSAQALAERIELLQDAFANRLAGRAVDAEALRKDSEQLPEGLTEAVDLVIDESNDSDKLRSRATANLESALQIAVEFEFLSGLDSPPEEKGRRMDHQVQRLAAKMSERSGQQDLGSELAALESRWYRSLPLPMDHFDALRARIEKCQAVVRQMMGIT